MGLPGHRRTSSHKRRRAAHFALKTVQVTVCQKCKSPVLPHRICKTCGFYKDRVVVATAEKRLARLTKHAHAGHNHAEEAAPAKSEKKEKVAKKAAAPKVAKTTKRAASKKTVEKPSV